MKNILQLDLNAIVRTLEAENYLEDDIYIFELSHWKFTNHPIKIDSTVCYLCLKGEAKGKIDLKPYQFKAPAFSIQVPEQILEQEFVSDDFSGICIIMSKRFCASLALPDSFLTSMSVRNNPIIELNENELEAMMFYCKTVQKVIRVTDNPNRLQIIKHLTIAFFYGIGYNFHKREKETVLSRNDALMQNFLQQVQIFHKKERKVLFYADKLCLSPKYLSLVIKECSGKTAAEWIDEYVVLEAKAMLKSTNMTVQQISDDLNFPSQSFFGKFFKRLTNMSPKMYREGK